MIAVSFDPCNIFNNSLTSEHPQVRDVDMLHAPDYSSFDLNDLQCMLAKQKKKDMSLQKSL